MAIPTRPTADQPEPEASPPSSPRPPSPGGSATADRPTMSRRAALSGLGALGAATLAAACGAGGSSTASSSSSTTGSSTTGSSSASGSSSPSASSGAGGGGTTAGSAVAGSAACTLTPEQTEGPYYLDLDLVRRDITEGKPGTPLELTLQVLDADGCTPLRDAAVDIWHCDAGGDYSGVADEIQQGSGTFLRGTQITDGDGKVTFATIWPGFYPGRAVHVHVKIHPTKTTQATTQLYFPDAMNAEVFRASPYSDHRGTVTSNARDGIFADGGPQLTLSPTKVGDGYRASFVAAVGAAPGGGAGRL